MPFSNEVRWKGGAEGEITFPDGKVDFALPAEFGGVEGLSPEDIYVGDANACVLTTTLSRAKKYGVVLESYEASAEGVMEKVGDGREITKIEIEVRLKANADLETLEKMVAEVARRVPVIRSMKTAVNINFQVE